MRIVIDLAPETPESEIWHMLRETKDAIDNGDMVSVFPAINVSSVRIEKGDEIYYIDQGVNRKETV